MDDDPLAERQAKAADTGPHGLRMESWFSAAPYELLLHMELVQASDGTATLTMPFLLQFAQGAALMHGGALMSLADTAMVMAIKSVLPPYTHFATVHVEADYLRPVTQGIVTARAQLTGRKGRKITGETCVFNDSSEPVLAFSGVFVVARDSRIKGVTFADDRK
ncbi:MAG: PaaI family thioesterase [Woeseia sp.]